MSDQTRGEGHRDPNVSRDPNVNRETGSSKKPNMAKIEIEKKPKSNWLPLLLALIAIGLAIWGIYRYLENQQREQAAELVPTDTMPGRRGDTIIRLELPESAGELTFVI